MAVLTTRIQRSELRDLWRVLEETCQRQVESEAKLLSTLFHDEGAKVLRALPDQERVLSAVHAMGPRWRDALFALYQRVGSDYGPPLTERLSRKSWDPKQYMDRALRLAKKRANLLVGSTKRRLRRVLDSAVDDVGVVISDLYDQWSTGRARSVADNEVRTAVGVTEADAARQTRSPLRKTWMSMEDAQVRDTHATYHGTSRAPGGEWAPGLKFPHDPDCEDPSEVCGCRCWLIYSVKRII